MKRKLKKIIVWVFLLFVFIVPLRVSALSYKSDYINLEDPVTFETDEFEFHLEYTMFSLSSDLPATIDVFAKRKNDDTYYYHYVMYFYDEQKQEVGSTDGYDEIRDDMLSTKGESFNFSLDERNSGFYNNFSKIKYYKFFIEESSKNVAEEYIYTPYTKINKFGLDPINDNNPIEMIEKNKKIIVDTTEGDYYINTYKENIEYELRKYDVNIVVNENNTFNITERINAYFNVPKHGIFRKIPLKNTVVRLDNTTSTNRAKIKDIKVNEQYTTSVFDNFKIIKIGDPNYTMTGTKDYEFSYLYNIGKDPNKEYDEFYFNIIGTEWGDTTISGVSFTITMPKEFDSSKLGFSSGNTGATNNSNISYNVNGNTITGNYNGTLKPTEALTVRLELPEGYFVGVSNNFDLFIILSMLIPVLFVAISFVMWKKYGKDNLVIKTVEFYPPKGFNSAEVGFLYKGLAGSEDVVSLLIYLANKGYIKISETEEKVMFSKTKGFKITKVKEYDGDNPNERLFLKGLFKARSKSILPKNMSFKEAMSMMKNPEAMAEKAMNEQVLEIQEVRSTDLYDNFYITLNAIVMSINSKENRKKIFEKRSLNKNRFLVLMIITIYLLISFRPVSETMGLGMILPAILFPGLGFSILFYMLLGKNTGPVYVNGVASNSKKPKIILGLLFGGFFGGIPWAFMVLPGLLNDPMYMVSYIVGVLCVIPILFFIQYMSKRTTYGNEILGKIEGFKNFLETAEKSKLETLVMEDPTYFYNILPFTYVLGVSDKWIKQFESISLQAPNWYSGSDVFNAAAFGSFMNNTMTSASNAMASSPSSNSSSGGGSSGGGSGGGGGGSW